jgi:hypothetical protein
VSAAIVERNAVLFEDIDAVGEFARYFREAGSRAARTSGETYGP